MSAFKAMLGGELYDSYIPPFQRHSATSREAAQSISGKPITDLQRRVLDYLKNNPQGATDEQMIDALGMNPSTLRPRRLELQHERLIVDSGRYAHTRSGRRATVWIVSRETSEANNG